MGELCDDEIGPCDICNDWVCFDCGVNCTRCVALLCERCAEEHAPRLWACCGSGGGEPEPYHPDCVHEEETEEEHGCVACGVCGATTCPAAKECLSCAAIAAQAAEAAQVPLRALDVRVAREALAAAKSESLRNLLQDWLDTHADAATAAGGASRGADKKRKK